MQLHQLRMVIEAGCSCSRLLKQHHADRKIGDHSSPHRGLFGKTSQLLQLLRREAGGPDDGGDAIGDGGTGVLVNHLGVGEIHQNRSGVLLADQTQRPFKVAAEGHIKLAEPQRKAGILPLFARASVDRPYQLAVLGSLDRFDHFGAHPTEGTGHHDWDLVCHKALLPPHGVESVRNLS